MSLIAIQRGMKQWMPLVIGFIFVFIAGTLLSMNYNGIGGGGNGGRVDNETFAKIGNDAISNAQFNHIVQQFQQYAQMSGRAVPMQDQAQLPGYAYDQLLNEYAAAAAARSRGLSVSEGDANLEIRNQIEETLKRIGEGATPAELSETRSALMAGADIAGKQRELLGQKLQQQLEAEAKPVEVKVAHVLIKTDKRSDAEARKLAEEVTRRARAGEDFAKLAKELSEDEGSKAKGGVAGWASAMPAPPDPTGKANPEAAGNFVPEFTNAALSLKPNEISNPIHSQFGWHVLKALEERPYKPLPPAPDPKGKPAKNDPNREQDELNSYKQSVATSVNRGLVEQQKVALSVQPVSPWLQGYLLEKELKPEAPPTTPASATEKTVAATKAAEVLRIVTPYNKALTDGGAVSGPGLAYKVAQLQQWAGEWYERAGQKDQAQAQYTEAMKLRQKWAEKTRDPEFYFGIGEIQEKEKKKSDALASYQQSMKQARSNTDVLQRLNEKFKTLGRTDLAKQAMDQQMKVQAEQMAEQQRMMAQQEAARRAMEAQQQKSAPPTAIPGGKLSTQPSAPGEAGVVGEVTVKTGDIDPKTGKPKILSVEPVKPGATPAAPATPAPATPAPATPSPAAPAAPATPAPAAPAPAAPR